MFSLRIVDVDLSGTQQTGLKRPRSALWNSALEMTRESFKKRKTSEENTEKYMHVLDVITQHKFAKKASREAKQGINTHLAAAFSVHRQLSEDCMRRFLSMLVNDTICFLPGSAKHEWTSPNVQSACSVLGRAFRSLLLCESIWIRYIPVCTVAAMMETFATNVEARDALWWWGEQNVQRLITRAIGLAGEGASKKQRRSARLCIQLLAFVIKNLSIVCENTKLDSRGYPRGKEQNESDGRSERRKLFMSVSDVEGLIALLDKLEWTTLSDQLQTNLEFQCDIVEKSTSAGIDLTEHCFLDEERDQIVVSCGQDTLLELSKVVNTVASLTMKLGHDREFMDLVDKTSIDKSFAGPFLLAQALNGNAMKLVEGAPVSRVCRAIEERVLDSGDLVQAKKGLPCCGGDNEESGHEQD